jgi:hypothetical protein
MKNLRAISSFLASLLLGSISLAQTATLPEGPQLQESSSMHSQSMSAVNQSATKDDETKMISQAGTFPRFPPRPMMPPRGRAYPSTFRPSPPPLSPVGALIGLGIGGVLGAAGSGDHTARGRLARGLIGGGLCALIGGAIGHAFSAISSHNFRDDDFRDNDRARRNRHDIAPVPAEPDVIAVAALRPMQLPEDSQLAKRPEIDDLASAIP